MSTGIVWSTLINELKWFKSPEKTHCALDPSWEEKKMCDTLFNQWMDGWMDGGQERRMRAWESDQNVFLAESEFHAHVG